MEVYSAEIDVQTRELEAVLTILRSYYDSLEDGTASTIVPKPMYKWRYWKDGLTVDRMRAGLEDIDEYLNEGPQRQWAENNATGGPRKFDTGPDLSRLSDGALIAMFQDLDAALADTR
jgi:hypothetical protein